ncbi:MAG: SRPBCC family protein [Caulobacter sp.]|nr:SRPBCC family protein [Caulobacter sp.]
MFKIIAIVVAAAIAGLLAYAATRPDTFRVSRSTVVNATPDKIYPLLDDFRRWSVWSPYEGLDPAMARTYSGPASGVGAAYAWDSKGRAGVGRMEIVQAQAPQNLKLRLDFNKPMKSSNNVTFTLEPQGAATRVTWTMEGPAPFISKLMGVIFNLDKAVGRDFEAGLAKLKAQAEA